MPMYNLLVYSGNYSMTSGSLWNYYKDEIMMLMLMIILQLVNHLTIKQK